MTRFRPSQSTLLFCFLFFAAGTATGLHGQGQPASVSRDSIPTVLFVGNSFTYGENSRVENYRPETVRDLNGTGIGGVPALFKTFTTEAGRAFAVSLETSPGKNLDFHLKSKADLIGQAWDYVLLQGYSVLDQKKPGDPALLVRSVGDLAALLQQKNPNVDIRLIATWSRADQTYPQSGHWHGQPIEQMALDVRKGYDLAMAKGGPAVRGVLPVGETWNRAIQSGLADPNPYDGIKPGEIDLWGKDHYHASSYGYYLYALVVFGDITGLDPRSLGGNERVATDLGFSPEQTESLEKIAYEELSSAKDSLQLKPFLPIADTLSTWHR